MELIAAVLIAGPLGYFVAPRQRALIAYLVVWAVIFPIQSIVVGIFDDFDVLYFVFNALILCLGLGLNRYGSVLAERRRTKPASAPASA
jgi:hypothetical protein